MSITFAATLIFGIPAVLSAMVDRTGRIPYRIGQVWARIILRLNGVRVRVEGLPNIDTKTSYVFISNHQSNLDGLAIGTSLPSPLRFVIKKSLLKIPIMGQAFKLGRMIPIDRSEGQKAIETINRCGRELTDGISALFFGEGRRSRDGKLQPFKKGGIIFSITSRLPLVPVTVVNSFNLMPAGALHIRKGTITIIIGTAIPTSGFGPEHADQLRERVWSVISENLKKYAPQTV
ncbi:MAG TPA: lysophospholipid acyltransferase family protein [Spirochaetota bacterium]|nr:lysophospholipid acyltransferase family protein [Spirochaetota bacterium]HPC42494.1 lysophospholipid acyltransferase family protein [Spirochaetota bacterium]HPL16066.1 lysophospholipid acyltransferase family protein [Spirochaetota bacterium]HQF10133.1 lysophospholipid acyltransferase family protein [Spirochaetota bacterium]HQH98838.1 lysophospholipid acyltransferase family protein [Spirochaetota bacterium]